VSIDCRTLIKHIWIKAALTCPHFEKKAPKIDRLGICQEITTDKPHYTQNIEDVNFSAQCLCMQPYRQQTSENAKYRRKKLLEKKNCWALS